MKNFETTTLPTGSKQQGLPRALGGSALLLAGALLSGCATVANPDPQQIVDSVRNQMAESTGEGGRGCGKAGAKSWLQAIAQAMGEAMGDKAAKMVELSGKLKEAAGGNGEDAAKEMQAVNAEFQAVSQEFKLLTDAFNTALKSLGEGMSSMARKQ